jgi:hypothetical protein
MTLLIAPVSGPVPTSTRDGLDPAGPAGPAWDLVDEWGAQSFPASDPPSNW